MSDRASGPAGPADGGAGGEGSSVPDGAWEAFQREAEESGRRGSTGAAGVPKEPSARARMVAARLREQDEAAAAAQRRGFGRRGKGKPPEPWQPDGWRTGPALYETRGGGGWRQSRRVGLVFAVLCLLVGGLWFADRRGHLNLGSPGAGGQREPLAVETGRPTGAPPTAAFSGLPTLERPWAGSPARRWDEGADAIELPAAEPVGDVSADALAGWGTTTPGTVWVTETIGEWAGVRCDAEADGMLHPDFPSERADGGGDGPTRDPYDRSREAGTGGADPAACGTATRV